MASGADLNDHIANHISKSNDLLMTIAHTLSKLEGRMDQTDARFEQMEDMIQNLAYNISGHGGGGGSKKSKAKRTPKTTPKPTPKPTPRLAPPQEDPVESPLTSPDRSLASLESEAVPPSPQSEKPPAAAKLEEKEPEVAKSEPATEVKKEPESEPEPPVAQVPQAPSSTEYVMKSKKARDRWIWAYQQIKIKATISKFNFAMIKVPENQSIGSRLDNCEGNILDLQDRLNDIREPPELAELQAYVHGYISDQIAKINSKLEDHSLRMTGVEESAMTLTERMETIGTEMGELSERVETAEAAVPTTVTTEQKEDTAPPETVPDAFPGAVGLLKTLRDDIGGVLSIPNVGTNEVITKALQEAQATLPELISTLTDEKADRMVMLSETARVVRKLQKADASLERSVLAGVNAADGSTTFSDRLTETLHAVRDAIEQCAHTGKMQISILDLEESLGGGGASGDQLAAFMAKITGDLAKKVGADTLEGYSKASDIEGLAQKISEIASDLKVTRDTLLTELKGGQNDKEAEAKQAIKGIAENLKNALQEFELIRSKLSQKEDTETVVAAFTEVHDKLSMLAEMGISKQGLEMLLEQKVDKTDLDKIAKGGSGAQELDIGKPFFAVYQCKKPFKPPGIEDAYAYSGDLMQHMLEDGTELPSIKSGSSQSSRPHTTSVTSDVYGRVQPQFGSVGPESSYTQDGPTYGKYPRMMPKPVRHRANAAGGQLTPYELKRMRVSGNSSSRGMI